MGRAVICEQCPTPHSLCCGLCKACGARDERAAVVALARRVIDVYEGKDDRGGFAAAAIHGLIVAIQRGEHIGSMRTTEP